MTGPSGHLFDRSVEAVAARMHREHRLEGLVEGELDPAPVEAMAAQPVLVRAGPGALFPHQALAAAAASKAGARAHQVRAAVFARPHQNPSPRCRATGPAAVPRSGLFTAWWALAAVRAVWQPSGASSWVRPRPDHHLSPAAGPVAGGGSPEDGALGEGAERPSRRRFVLLPATSVVLVAAAVAVVGGPGAGRAARDEVRSESVAGPEGPATAGAPAPALAAGGAR